MSETFYFELPYWVANCGDGSVSVNFEQFLEDAERKDEEMDEGWGESSASTVSLKVENNQLFLKSMKWSGKQ